MACTVGFFLPRCTSHLWPLFSIIQTHFLLPRAQLFNDNWQFVIGVGNVVAMPITCHMNVMFENSLAPHVRFSGADDIFLENCNNAGTDVVFVTSFRSRARVRYLWAT